MANLFKKCAPADPVKGYTYQWIQVAEALVRAQGLHEGLWRVGMQFDLRAANVTIAKDVMVPGAFLPVVHVNLVRVETADYLTVDAAVVNPGKRLIVPSHLVN